MILEKERSMDTLFLPMITAYRNIIMQLIYFKTQFASNEYGHLYLDSDGVVLYKWIFRGRALFHCRHGDLSEYKLEVVYVITDLVSGALLSLLNVGQYLI